MKINEIKLEGYKSAVKRGHYKEKPSEEWIQYYLSCIGDEVSEARDAIYKRVITEEKDSLPSELADIVIHVCSLSEYLGIDLEKQIAWKMDYNEKRKD